MALTLLSNSTLVQTMAARMASASRSALDFSVGSVLRAIVEAVAGVLLWVQWLVLQVLKMTRAATSEGADLDTWMADFSLTRQAAIPAAGMVTFARFTSSIQAVVYPGTLVKTTDGSQSFIVYADSSKAAWNATLGGYVAAVGIASIDAPVVASVGGIGGNVSAAAISLLATAVPGIDTVTNASAFTTGIDAESDAAFRTRFANYINTRFQATALAIGYAISAVQQGLTYTIAENVTAGGSYAPGNFVVTVDNGTGSPGSPLLANVQTAVDAVRPIGSTYVVQGPSVVTATVAFTLTAATGYVKANMIAPIQTAVAAYINALPMGAALRYSRIAQIVYDAVPGVANVSAITLNSGTADLGGGTAQVVRAGTITVS